MTKNILIKDIDRGLQKKYSMLKNYASKHGLLSQKLLSWIISDAIEEFLRNPDISKYQND